MLAPFSVVSIPWVCTTCFDFFHARSQRPFWYLHRYVRLMQTLSTRRSGLSSLAEWLSISISHFVPRDAVASSCDRPQPNVLHTMYSAQRSSVGWIVLWTSSVTQETKNKLTALLITSARFLCIKSTRALIQEKFS